MVLPFHREHRKSEGRGKDCRASTHGLNPKWAEPPTVPGREGGHAKSGVNFPRGSVLWKCRGHLQRGAGRAFWVEEQQLQRPVSRIMEHEQSRAGLK